MNQEPKPTHVTALSITTLEGQGTTLAVLMWSTEAPTVDVMRDFIAAHYGQGTLLDDWTVAELPG